MSTIFNLNNYSEESILTRKTWWQKFIDLLDKYYVISVSVPVLTILSALGCVFITEEALQFFSGQELVVKENATQNFVRGLGWLFICICFPLLLLTEIFHIFVQQRINSLRSEFEETKFRLNSDVSTLEIKNSKLSDDLEALGEDFKAAAKGYVRNIGADLGFGTKNHNTERITVYAHNSTGVFIPFGRYASNPKYELKGRDFYSDDQGCISEAWQNGHHFIDNIPSWDTAKKSYLKIATRYGFTEEEVDKLNMKSQLLFGWRIIDNIQGNQYLGVIIVESIDKSRWTEKELTEYFQRENEKLSQLFGRLIPWLTNISSARKDGF